MESTKAITSKQATISNSAVGISTFGFSTTDLVRAEVATITVLSGAVMALYDGNTPTATFGQYLASESMYSLVGNDAINALKMIRQASVNGIVTVTVEYGN